MDKKNIKRRIVKRKRGLPYRKWSDYETTLLVDYLKENAFEMPSGRIFYQKFVEIYHMNIDWSLVKNKMRNLKALFQKAQSWQRTAATNNIPEGETIQSIVDRMCPLYHSLEEVFGNKDNKNKLKEKPKSATAKYNSVLEIEDTEDSVIKTTYSAPSTPQPPYERISVTDIAMENQSTNITVNKGQLPVQNEPADVSVENLDTTTNITMPSSQNQNHDACSCLMEFAKILTSYQQNNNEYQKSRLELEQKKFDFEKEKAFRELELRQREIEKNERLQILEIESKERITLKELEYKYKRL